MDSGPTRGRYLVDRIFVLQQSSISCFQGLHCNNRSSAASGRTAVLGLDDIRSFVLQDLSLQAANTPVFVI